MGSLGSRKYRPRYAYFHCPARCFSPIFSPLSHHWDFLGAVFRADSHHWDSRLPRALTPRGYPPRRNRPRPIRRHPRRGTICPVSAPADLLAGLFAVLWSTSLLRRRVSPRAIFRRVAAALVQSGNQDLTLIIYPGASHAIGKTRTGELGEEWLGYVPEYLDDMTDWVLQQASGAKRPEGWSQRGRAAASDQPFAPGHYDRLRWYGSAPLQAIQFIVFVAVFVGAGVAGTIRLVRRGYRDQTPIVTRSGKWLTRVATLLSFVNLALLTGLITLTRALADAWQPKYPAFLNWLPLAGLLSACLTLTLVALIFAHWRALAESRRKRTGWLVLATGGVAFLPFLHYWDLLGLAWPA